MLFKKTLNPQNFSKQFHKKSMPAAIELLYTAQKLSTNYIFAETISNYREEILLNMENLNLL